jgi:hypothetical protein
MIDIMKALVEGRFSLIHSKNGNIIGYFTFVKTRVEDKNWLYVGNFKVLKNYQDQFSLLHLRRLLRKRFKNIDVYYWHRDKTNKYYYHN